MIWEEIEKIYGSPSFENKYEYYTIYEDTLYLRDLLTAKGLEQGLWYFWKYKTWKPGDNISSEMYYHEIEFIGSATDPDALPSLLMEVVL